MPAAPTAYTPGQIADWFLGAFDRSAGDVITPLKLQKLVYYAQAWSLALRGRPLFDEDFQAWMHGPVLCSLRKRFVGRGWEALGRPEEMPALDEETESLLRDVLSTYGEHSARALEALTHNEEPWIRARGSLPPEARCREIIPKDHMRSYYRHLYEALDAEG
jgi:uncharacterized phage-associated protein